MGWKLDSERPIYSQIMERVSADIISGRYSPGEKLPSVRELAAEAAVNPNTMQKALSELERTGLVKSQRTSGRFITEDTNLIEETKTQLAKNEIRSFLNRMKAMGIVPAKLEQYIHELVKEEEQ
jgi:GntR family transcriptional regulator